jgi:hypothetical protein
MLELIFDGTRELVLALSAFWLGLAVVGPLLFPGLQS